MTRPASARAKARKSSERGCSYCGRDVPVYPHTSGINTYWECARCHKDPDGRRAKSLGTEKP